MPTFGSWEATVLEQAYDDVDFISAHAYYEDLGDTDSFLASSVNMDDFIHDVVSTADYVRAKLNKKKRINISFDEWNVWYLSRVPASLPETWAPHPRISEEPYTVADAVVVGSLLITLLRHSDRVTAACQAQLVNTISSIRTEPGGPAWRQSIFHPFAQAARLAKGRVLGVETVAPTYDTEKYGEVAVIDAVATHDEESGEVVVLAVNRSQSDSVELAVDLRAFGDLRVAEATVLADDDIRAANTAEQPDRVAPRPAADVRVDGGALRAVLPAVSWNAIRLTRTGS
jgi:alpha-N-arabinofuranosidase